MSLGRRDDGLKMRRDEPVVTIKALISGYGEVAIDVPADDDDEAIAVFIEYLAPSEGESDWRTISAVIDGSHKRITFRASWVSGFSIRD
jgi:hypothetical protein